ncbi:beta-glucosidase 12 isoform X2 [Morus notabilis]|uniref:beta-glucosidase 12 isoform X2 n=1 Tax=Morus notabilis TaxID=981085 RepID=UPI000CED7EE9|nr:beta-glucosidase 12 isoform X2 [Morus notabilis]
MKDMNTDAYRFSISWNRLLPNGTINGGVNKEGIQYYNNLIDELHAKGLTPFVTIFHWDIPQILEKEYGGFLSPRVVGHFKDYADLCFKEFGDKVKHWITINEPYTYAAGGYVNGFFAPGRCSAWQNLNCTGGDSGTEPYLVSHHMLLSHAAAVKVYRDKYQASQKGVIGITHVTSWYVPYADVHHHLNAASRSLDFAFGWYMDPLVHGHYPHTMRVLVGKRLPKFTKEESKLVKGSYDFIGVNYYTSNYAAYAPNHNKLEVSYTTDSRTNQTTEKNGVPIGEQATGSSWLYVYPQGFYDLLNYTKTKYNNPLIYVTENGISEKNDPTLTLKQALNDTQRIDYHFRHLTKLREAIRDGVNVKGYFAWSLLDNFEWGWGYTVRFGINYVDFDDGQKRYPKLSAHWFTRFLKKKKINYLEYF